MKTSNLLWFFQGYDIPRAIIVSLAMFLSGLVLFAIVQAWRQRHLPVPSQRMPFSVIASFCVSYLLLLMLLVVDRWAVLGNPPTWRTWLALAVLLGNVLSVWVMVHYAHDWMAKPARSLQEEFEVATSDFRRSMRLLHRMTLLHWRQLHPGTDPPPAMRFEDRLLDMTEEELGQIVTIVAGSDKS